jgi:hypothetical protein
MDMDMDMREMRDALVAGLIPAADGRGPHGKDCGDTQSHPESPPKGRKTRKRRTTWKTRKTRKTERRETEQPVPTTETM